MQGPQALASTVASMAWREAIWPSRSMVARTCSEPGVTMRGVAAATFVLAGLVGDVGGAAHVLVGGVGAAADEGGVDGVDEAVGAVGDLGGEHGYGAGPVGGVGPDDVGLEGREVDLDEPVEVGRGVGGDLGVGCHEGRVGVGEVGQVAPAGGAEVSLHAPRHTGIRRWSRRAPRPCW